MKQLNKVSRREFVHQTALGLGLFGGASLAGIGCHAPHVRTAGKSPSLVPKVALVGTEVRKHSHAQHFIDRFLEGYGWQGHWHRPKVRLASLYIDQFPEGDLAHDRSNRFGVRLYPTVEEALTLGGPKLAVDGVIIIGEHGKYPRNEMGQTLYPRYAFFKKAVNIFESSGRSVPVFQDKHLSTQWNECVEEVADSKRLGFAFLAGSSLPVTWRIPSVEIPWGAPLTESVCVCYGGVDSYDFHGLETAQCMSERRRGGEVGIRALQALRGKPAWERVAASPSTVELVLAALAQSHSLRAPPGYTYWTPTPEWLASQSENCIGYFMEHSDGFRTTMLLWNGLVQDFTYAGREEATGRIYGCQMHLPMPGRNSTTADFFNPLAHHIERMVLTGRTPYRVERTELTSGMTLTAVRSLHLKGEILQTPELSVKYMAPRGSHYLRA